MHDTVVVVVVIVVMMVTMICSIVLQGSLIFIGLPLTPPKEGRPNGGVGLRFTNLTFPFPPPLGGG